MKTLFQRLWKDDCGALIATEWVFVATILVLGIITGLIAVRQAVISELTEFANAVMALDQSFSFAGQSNCLSSTAGSAATDPGPSLINESSVASTTLSVITQVPCD
jgi:Flp pilus assembly pilin Flp